LGPSISQEVAEGAENSGEHNQGSKKGKPSASSAASCETSGLQLKAYRLELLPPCHVGPAGIALAGDLGVVAAVLADVVGGGEVGVVLVAGGGGTGPLGENGIAVFLGAHAPEYTPMRSSSE